MRVVVVGRGFLLLLPLFLSHHHLIHARTHARTHVRAHARMHARTLGRVRECGKGQRDGWAGGEKRDGGTEAEGGTEEEGGGGRKERGRNVID